MKGPLAFLGNIKPPKNARADLPGRWTRGG